MLANVYAWFTEGFDTPDLGDARTSWMPSWRVTVAAKRQAGRASLSQKR
jgi:hypothetical protein